MGSGEGMMGGIMGGGVYFDPDPPMEFRHLMSQTHQQSPPRTETPIMDETRPRLGAGLPLDDPQSPLAPYYLRGSHVVAVMLLAGLFVLLTLVPLWHTDIWGHLKFGQWMVQNQQLPTREPLSPFADSAAPSLHTYWLSQTVLYLTFQAGEWLGGGDEVRRLAGGVSFLHLAHALTVVLRCVVLIVAFRRQGCSLALALVGLVGLLGLSIGHLAILRPQVFGELFLACLLLSLSRPVLSTRSLILIPLLIVLWSNSHGSFALGLMLLGVFLTGRVLQVMWETRTWNPLRSFSDSQVKRVGLVLLLSIAAAALLNPHGPWLFWNTILMGRHPNVQVMDEWQPLFWARSPEPIWIYGISMGLIALTPLIARKGYSIVQLLILGVFALLPLAHVRMEIWWLMFVPWLILPLWAHYTPRIAFLKRFETIPNIRKTVMAVLIVIVAFLWSTPGLWLLNGQPCSLEQSVSQATPLRAAKFLREPTSEDSEHFVQAHPHLRSYQSRDRFPGVVFTSETLGDFFLWNDAPRTSVFVYTHVHLFPSDHWKEVACVRTGSVGWKEILDRRRINMVVVEAEQHQRLRQLLANDPAWQVVVDETGDRSKVDDRTRLLVALRKEPIFD